MFRRHNLKIVNFQSSTPQNSRSAATSSTPTSQPSGRCTPAQTTTASAFCCVVRFVTRNRCCKSSALGLTNKQPYEFTTRVQPVSKWSVPLPPFHSIDTGTREFMRELRRFCRVRISRGRSSSDILTCPRGIATKHRGNPIFPIRILERLCVRVHRRRRKLGGQ